MVSVIMAVYNCEKYLHAAVDSILNQTFSDFELIIVDDCSTDHSYAIMQNYEKQDHRVRVFQMDKNSGQGIARNEGVRRSNGKYIAFMDGDDISMPERLQVQFDFMETNPAIGVTTSNIVLFKNDDEIISQVNYPQKNVAIKWALFFECALVVGVSMMRRDIFDTPDVFRDFRKDRSEYYPEDYDLWVRLAPKTNLYNFLTPLLSVRKHESNITHVKLESNLRYFTQINRQYILDNFNIQVQVDTAMTLCNISDSGNTADVYQTIMLYYKEFMARQRFLAPEDHRTIDSDMSERLVNLFFRYRKSWRSLKFLLASLRFNTVIPVKKIINYLKK